MRRTAILALATLALTACGPDDQASVSATHSLWFHRPVLMDQWVLIDYRPVSNSGARGLVLGTAYSIGGELLASTAQEVVIRSGAPR